METHQEDRVAGAQAMHDDEYALEHQDPTDSPPTKTPDVDVELQDLFKAEEDGMSLEKEKNGGMASGKSLSEMDDEEEGRGVLQEGSSAQDSESPHCISDDDGYDELFDDIREQPRTPLPASIPTMRPSVSEPESQYHFTTSPPADLADPPAQLDLSTVMTNVATLKQAIVSNHLILTRFFHLQSAYRTVSANLSTERSLREVADSTIARLRDDNDALSHDNPLLQFQNAQLKEECRKERAIRMSCEASMLQYQSDIQLLKKQINQVKENRIKSESDLKNRYMETVAEAEKYKTKVLALMRENRKLINDMIEGTSEDQKKEKENLVQRNALLTERVKRLEALNIRLKAGRSVLSGGEGNNPSDFLEQPVPPLPPPPPPPPPRSTESTASGPGISKNADDEVVFMGMNTSPILQAHLPPSTEPPTSKGGNTTDDDAEAPEKAANMEAESKSPEVPLTDRRE